MFCALHFQFKAITCIKCFDWFKIRCADWLQKASVITQNEDISNIILLKPVVLKRVLAYFHWVHTHKFPLTDTLLKIFKGTPAKIVKVWDQKKFLIKQSLPKFMDQVL